MAFFKTNKWILVYYNFNWKKKWVIPQILMWYLYDTNYKEISDEDMGLFSVT